MRTILATCLLVLALVPAALAASPAGDAAQPDDMFAAMDANKDGVLTKEEFTAHGMGNDFATYDQNGDGKVTRSEYDAVAPSKDGQKHGM